jgi:hypothetical protein
MMEETDEQLAERQRQLLEEQKAFERQSEIEAELRE